MVDSTQSTDLESQFELLAIARQGDPFRILGRHREDADEVVRVFLPFAHEVWLEHPQVQLMRRTDSGVFEWRGEAGTVPDNYRLRWQDYQGNKHEQYDSYAFGLCLSDDDLYLFGEGRHWHAQDFLGAHPKNVNGIDGVVFSTWAPNALRVSVVGNFNRWDGRCHPMRSRGGGGIWEIFIPGLAAGELYKFEMRNQESGEICLKADPFARRAELRPNTASITAGESAYAWQDQHWLEQRGRNEWLSAPMSIYELHLGSWQRDEDGNFLSYRAIAERLVPYLEELGFTHVELLPITEHPFDGSWGYQSTGFFAPTSRFGDPDGLRELINQLHAKNIGVLLDWVPGHFPRDAYGLASYDGTALFEHVDPRRGEHRDWGTLIFNYARDEVRSFLISSALYWIKSFHFDGLRVDAVASMLYLDYSREPGQWLPNQNGGNENLEAVAFLRELNSVVQTEQPGTVIIAEESTAWPQVSQPPDDGGLGFSMKWNMGWMHDTLSYMAEDPIHRKYLHDRLTFGMMYAHTENFVLPFSHDEVVHGKRALLHKLPGDEWQKFASLRLLYTYQFTYPGKKLLFMGCEFGQRREWSEERALDWWQCDEANSQGLECLIGDLNHVYRENRALHELDFEPGQGFEWIDCEDREQSVLVFMRKDRQGDLIVVGLNFTPVPRLGLRYGVPHAGRYVELLNSDAAIYCGSAVGNQGGLNSDPVPSHGHAQSIVLTLPPLAGVILKFQPVA